MENCSAACEGLLHAMSVTIRDMYQTMEAVLAELDDVFDRPCVQERKALAGV
ncbi:MAG: hypothetical protein PHT96_13880 [Syntrophorhabdaceae bacterium]|nr:hypothetical protein [Syntrophorhabdaceae bacterium]MDD4197474.1 hypothetical protein [Syntrophorhabdaceae bacterium]